MFLDSWKHPKVLNMHSLHHLADKCAYHGPLATSWAYSFEAALAILKPQNHAHRLPEKQLCLAANLLSCLPFLEAAFIPAQLSDADQSVSTMKTA